MAWTGRHATDLKARVFAIHGDICCLCGHPGADTVEHLLPRHHGGTDGLDNLRPSHGRKRPALGCPGNYGRPCPICKPNAAPTIKAVTAPGW